MKKENGSIAVFTLVALLFMAAFLIISYANIVNNSKSLKEQFSIIKGIYYKSNDNSSYTDVYTDLRRKNRQNLTAYVENSNALKIEKTFESKLVNYKIYGNSVQNGTPTPDSPVEIENVGTKSKNLINVQDFNVTYEGYYHNSSTGFLLQPNCTYTLSFNYKINSASENVGCGIGYGETYYAKDINYMTTYPNQTSGRFVDTFTTPADIGNDKYLFVRFARTARTANVNVDFSSIQLETGSEATDYVPYGKYAVPIKVSGKNLLPDNVYNISNWEYVKYKTYRYSLDDYIKDSEYVTLSFKHKLHDAPGTYSDYMGYFYVVSSTDDFETSNTDVNLVQNTTIKAFNYTFKVEKNKKYKLFWYADNNEFENIYDIQIEDGSAVTDYEPYKSTKTQIYINEPLRKSGDYADYIDFKNGKVVRNIRKMSINSSLDWRNNWYAEFDVLLFLMFDEELLVKYPSKVLNNYTDINSDVNFGVSNNSGSGMGLLKCSTYWKLSDSIDELKTWLDNHSDMYALYVLKNPTEENIELPELPSFDYTKIEVLTEVPPSKIEVEYDGYTLD